MTMIATGASVLVGGDAALADLTTPDPVPAEPVDPFARIPRKGLRYKDRATRLALAAAHEALTDAGLLTADGLTVPAESVAVVVSSNLGNVDTICRVVQTIAEEGAARTSPMDLPNASSNVIASSVAIQYGLRGPNLMLCNGATSGLDAVRWARVLLDGGRAGHVLVLGVEPDNDAVRRLTGRERMLDGGAAVVFETAATALARGATARLEVGGYHRAGGVDECLTRLGAGDPTTPAAWYVPEAVDGDALPAGLLPGVPRHDLSHTWGWASGALGVLQCAAAIGRFDRDDTGPFYALNGVAGDDATAGVVLRRPVGATR
jgi:3-oxoacyl-[acyl-carrier-protein] synthase II